MPWSGNFAEFVDKILSLDPRAVARNGHEYIWDMIRWQGHAVRESPKACGNGIVGTGRRAAPRHKQRRAVERRKTLPILWLNIGAELNYLYLTGPKEFPRLGAEPAAAMRGVTLRPITQRRLNMTIRIGNEAPDFTAHTTEGKIRFHEWIGDKWASLFSHPKDFTPVCTTELGYVARLKPEFDERNSKAIGLSVDPVSDHNAWVGDIKETQGYAVNFPLIGDADLVVSKLYDMIHPNATGGKRSANDNATVRSVFIIGPDKKVKAMLV